MSTRRGLAVAVSLAVLLAFAGPAAAVVERWRIQNGATLERGGIRIYGQAECTTGETLEFRATARQEGVFGLGNGTFTCINGIVKGSFVIWPDGQSQFHTGKAAVRASATADNGDQRTVKKYVNVVDPTDPN